MTRAYEPNPPSRKEEDFPKTTTIPAGWVMPELMEHYNGEQAAESQEMTVPATGGRASVQESRTTPCEELFSRRLEPFQATGNAFGMWS